MRKDRRARAARGNWLTRWSRDETKGWRILHWEATDETLSRAREPVFIDVTAQALGQTASYKNQMLRGVDHWRTVLEAPAESTSTATTASPSATSTMMALTISTFASPPGFPTGSIAIAATAPSKT